MRMQDLRSHLPELSTVAYSKASIAHPEYSLDILKGSHSFKYVNYFIILY